MGHIIFSCVTLSLSPLFYTLPFLHLLHGFPFPFIIETKSSIIIIKLESTNKTTQHHFILNIYINKRTTWQHIDEFILTLCSITWSCIWVYATKVFLNDLAFYCQTIITTLKQKLPELHKKNLSFYNSKHMANPFKVYSNV